MLRRLAVIAIVLTVDALNDEWTKVVQRGEGCWWEGDDWQHAVSCCGCKTCDERGPASRKDDPSRRASSDAFAMSARAPRRPPRFAQVLARQVLRLGHAHQRREPLVAPMLSVRPGRPGRRRPRGRTRVDQTTSFKHRGHADARRRRRRRGARRPRRRRRSPRPRATVEPAGSNEAKHR